ncbi:MAG TPA: hypothetical protein VMI10_05420 [Terriglobales bacterium]|nr:hypothetical protein [Terriglobales bacterium]
MKIRKGQYYAELRLSIVVLEASLVWRWKAQHLQRLTNEAKSIVSEGEINRQDTECIRIAGNRIEILGCQA